MAKRPRPDPAAAANDVEPSDPPEGTEPPGLQWKPIASAPRDGTDLLVGVLGGRQLVARWSAVPGEGWVALDRYPVAPTHWRPLQGPPPKET